MRKLFPYQEKILALGKTLEDYQNLKEYLKGKGIDLAYHSGKHCFRLTRFEDCDTPNTAIFGVCWLPDYSRMIELFDNTDEFLENLF